jgi:hypothetical protein
MVEFKMLNTEAVDVLGQVNQLSGVSNYLKICVKFGVENVILNNLITERMKS